MQLYVRKRVDFVNLLICFKIVDRYGDIRQICLNVSDSLIFLVQTVVYKIDDDDNYITSKNIFRETELDLDEQACLLSCYR